MVGVGFWATARSRQLTVRRVVSELECSVSSDTRGLQTVRRERGDEPERIERVREQVIGDLEETERESKGLRTKDLRLVMTMAVSAPPVISATSSERRRPGGLFQAEPLYSTPGGLTRLTPSMINSFMANNHGSAGGGEVRSTSAGSGNTSTNEGAGWSTCMG